MNLALPTEDHRLRKRWSLTQERMHSPLLGSITPSLPAQTSNFPGRCPREAAWPVPPSTCCL